jgi:hypothetical protein
MSEQIKQGPQKRVLSRSQEAVFLGLALAPFIWFVSTNLNNDLWWDEIVSLRTYTLVSFTQTITTFLDTNNHILFNLINNAYTRLLGERDFYDLIEKTSQLRILQAFFACATLAAVYGLCRKFFDSITALVALVILTTTIPYLNFVVQLRGYNLSMLFVTLCLLFFWNSKRSPSALNLTMLGLNVCALIYTIPSNISITLSLAVLAAVNWCAVIIKFIWIKSSADKPGWGHKNPGLPIVLAITAGMAIAFIMYLPVLRQLTGNNWVSALPANRGFALSTLMPKVIFYFFSCRFALCVLGLIGVLKIADVRLLKQRDFPALSSKWFETLWLLLGPFLVVFISNHDAPQRLFVPLAPIFTICLAVPVACSIQKLDRWKHVPAACLAAIYLYCITTAVFEMNRNQRVYKKDFLNAAAEQTMYRSCFLSRYFKPAEAIDRLAVEYKNRPAPVLLLYEIDRLALQISLEKHHVDAYFQEHYDKFAPDTNQEIMTRIIALDGMTRSCSMTPMTGTRSKENEQFGEFISMFLFLSYKKSISSYYVVTADPQRFENIARQFIGGFSISKINLRDAILSCYFMERLPNAPKKMF